MSSELVPLDERRLALIERQAKVLAHGPDVPSNPDEVAYLMLRAIGFGIDPLNAFQHLHLIQTKHGTRLVVSSAFLGGMARRAGAKIEWGGSDQQQATARLRRPGENTWTTLTYTIDDAKKAGLVNKDNWVAHPAPMLRAACQRQLVRMAMPEVLLGLPAGDTVDLDAEFEDEGWEDEGGGSGPVVGESAPDPGPPLVDEKIRSQLGENISNLRPSVKAAVADHARNLGMIGDNGLWGPNFTRANAALLRRLIIEAENEQAMIDFGHPAPDSVHDDAPEAGESEEGSEHYDPQDLLDPGRPFTRPTEDTEPL
jgi:hypothetical protein